MASGGTHRIGSAELKFIAPKDAPHAQMEADRAARQAKARLAARLAAKLPDTIEYVVIDRVNCTPVSAPNGSDPIEALASSIADAIASKRPGRGVWRFASETAYVAAFLSACLKRTPPTGPEWAGLRHAISGGLTSALVTLCEERALAPYDVLAALPESTNAARILASATEAELATLTRQIDTSFPKRKVGSEALVAAARTLLKAAGQPHVDGTSLASAILALPINWSDPTSLTDAVARGVKAGGWPSHDMIGTRKHASPETHHLRPIRALPAALSKDIADTIASLSWLDGDRLKTALSTSIEPPPSTTEAEAIKLLDRALSALAESLSGNPSVIGKSEAVRILWHAAVARIAPDRSTDSTLTQLIETVIETPQSLLPATLRGLKKRWGKLRSRPPPGPAPDRAANPPRRLSSIVTEDSIDGQLGASNSMPQSSSTEQIETKAAGLFLLWRTLTDVHFHAAAAAICGEDEFATRALWAICRTEMGIDMDIGAFHFVGLADHQCEPSAITAEQSDQLAERLARAPAVRLASAPVSGLNETLLTAFTYWIRGFEHSSAGFARRNFLHRRGTLHVGSTHLEVRMEPRPFDLVLHRAGYLSPLVAPDWLGGLHTRFSIEDTS